MAKVIRITDVPEDVYATLNQQARAAGRSLSEHAREQLERAARGEPRAAPPAAPTAPSSGPESGADVTARLRGTEVNRKR